MFTFLYHFFKLLYRGLATIIFNSSSFFNCVSSCLEMCIGPKCKYAMYCIVCVHYGLVAGLRPCSHLFRFAFRSRSGPVPLVRVAFTRAKIDRTRSGFGPVTRSHLFRSRSGTRTVSIIYIPGC